MEIISKKDKRYKKIVLDEEGKHNLFGFLSLLIEIDREQKRKKSQKTRKQRNSELNGGVS